MNNFNSFSFDSIETTSIDFVSINHIHENLYKLEEKVNTLNEEISNYKAKIENEKGYEQRNINNLENEIKYIKKEKINLDNLYQVNENKLENLSNLIKNINSKNKSGNIKINYNEIKYDSQKYSKLKYDIIEDWNNKNKLLNTLNLNNSIIKKIIERIKNKTKNNLNNIIINNYNKNFYFCLNCNQKFYKINENNSICIFHNEKIPNDNCKECGKKTEIYSCCKKCKNCASNGCFKSKHKLKILINNNK